MATDHSIDELLAAANEALAEAGFRTGDFSTARDLAEQAQAEASRTADAAAHARALNVLGMVAHYENITMLMSGSKPSSADVDSEEKLFRQALVRWQELGRPPAAEQPTAEPPAAEQPEAEQPGAEQAEAEQPGADQPGADQPGADQPGAEQSGAEQPLAEQADSAQPAASQTEMGAVGTAQALFGLGLVFQVLHNDWMTAMPYFWQALDLVTKPEAAADLYLRSEVHRHVGFYFLVEDVRPPQAVRHLQLSLDLREQLADPRRIPSGRQALAQAELSAGNRDRAVELLTQAVAEARKAGLTQWRIEDVERDLRDASGTPDAGNESMPPEASTSADTEPTATDPSAPTGTEPTATDTEPTATDPSAPTDTDDDVPGP
jgi:tetratricopeptide (TPR) repeat protein